MINNFKIWKTITINKKPDLSGINISNYVQDMLDKIKWDKKEKIDLIKVKVSDLGFTDAVTTENLFTKAKKLGLELCPLQVGPILRVKYKNQPTNELLYIGMKPIASRYDDPLVFSLEHYADSLWLGNSWARPDNKWSPECGFVFRVRKDSLKLKPLSETLKYSIVRKLFECGCDFSYCKIHRNSKGKYF